MDCPGPRRWLADTCAALLGFPESRTIRGAAGALEVGDAELKGAEGAVDVGFAEVGGGGETTPQALEVLGARAVVQGVVGRPLAAFVVEHLPPEGQRVGGRPLWLVPT